MISDAVRICAHRSHLEEIFLVPGRQSLSQLFMGNQRAKRTNMGRRFAGTHIATLDGDDVGATRAGLENGVDIYHVQQARGDGYRYSYYYTCSSNCHSTSATW